MHPRLALFLAVFIGGSGAWAQQADDGPIKMQPELALAIPLLLKGKDVTLKYPILINRTTVVKPGMTLRVLYVPPIQDDSVNLVIAHMGNMEESYSRSAPPTEGQPAMSPDVAHEIERQRRVVWEVPVNFQLALAQLPTENLHLIYSQTGDNRHLDDERLNFFDGLFLGAPAGGVGVLAVEVGSKAEAAGFKVGDQILSVAGRPTVDLASFSALWSSAHASARESNLASIPVEIRSADASEVRTLNLPMPPTIKSQLMQGF